MRKKLFKKALILGATTATLLSTTLLANAAGWVNNNSTWYYVQENGANATGWFNDNGTWYYLNADGSMKTGWLNDSGTWYYLDGSGAMKTGWLQEGTVWYYLKSSGAMAVNETVEGSYYVNASGVWTEQEVSVPSNVPEGAVTDEEGNIFLATGYCQEYADEFVRLWNQERATLGLEPVVITEWAQKYSDIRAREITERFVHVRLDGTSIRGAEVITQSITSGSTMEAMARYALTNFKNSEAHWSLMSDPDIVECGVSVYVNGGTAYVSVNMYSYDEDFWGPDNRSEEYFKSVVLAIQ